MSYMGMPEDVAVTGVGEPQKQVETTEPVKEPEAAAAPPVAEPVASVVEAPKAEEPKVVERVVEKLIYPEFKDERGKAIYEKLQSGEVDDVYNYLSKIKKNYDTMSDVDLIREGLATQNPSWTKDRVDMELRFRYGTLEKKDLEGIDKEAFPDEYRTASEHNDKVDANKLKLDIDREDFKILLKEQQKSVEFPKLAQQEQPPQPVTKAEPTEDELAAAKKFWAEQAELQVKDLADFKFQVGDDKNPEEVVYVITPEEKAARIEAMKNWDGTDFMKRRGWMKEDGSFNLLRIAEDEQILENFNKMAKAIATTIRPKATKETLATIKNVDLDSTKTTAVEAPQPNVGSLIWN